MLRACSLAAAVLCTASALPAQTLYTLTPGGPLSSTVVQLTGPPGGACAYPNGPILGAFPTFVPGPCPTPGAVPPPPAGLLGDIAHSQVTDTIWVTAGPFVTGYTPAGAPLATFPTPPPLGPLTGLGMNSAAGLLWMTDGIMVGAVVAPPAGACGPVPLILPPFPSPSPGPLTDIEWDPFSGTLFGCDAAGFVTNMTVAGAVGPFAIFPAVPGCAPALVPPLTGIAVDTGTPSVLGPPLTLTVSNGFIQHRIVPGGGVSPPTFYAPMPCGPLVGGPSSGICSALHGITYGVGCNTGLGPVPTVAVAGNSTTPGALVVTLGAAPPGGLAWMIADIAPLCPAVAFKGCPMYTLPVFVFGPFPIPATGMIALPLGLPAALPIGAEAFGQWICNPPGPGWALSPGFEFTIGMP
jgi:hypothetical protein